MLVWQSTKPSYGFAFCSIGSGLSAAGVVCLSHSAQCIAPYELLGEGADPNQPDPDFGGFRPLHLAVDIECENSCRRYDAGDENARPKAIITTLLLNAGANPDLFDFHGQSARDIARERNHREADELFRKLG